MCKLSKTRPLTGHSSIGSINTCRKLHPGVPPLTTESNKGGSVPVIWQNQARRLPEVHPESIVLQHQGEDPTGKPDTPYLQHYTYSNVSSRTPKTGITSRLTGAGSLLPPVYSEAWAKGIPRTPFSSLRDAAHGKHAGLLTNGVSRKKNARQHNQSIERNISKRK
ncbi:hypothetical protein TNCV_2585961 [Trichonephila clavipes]|nr:hypothetical protein TNCV_2585961 [Trichonephila clavipes]